MIIDQRANVLGHGASDYVSPGSHSSWQEQDPKSLLSGVVKAVRQAVDHAPVRADACRGMSVGGAYHSLMAIDRHGEPLTGVMTWIDERPSKVTTQIRKSIDPQALYLQTGCPVHSLYPLYKLIWLREEKTEINAALRAVLSRIEEQKKEIYIDLQANVNKILMPILHELAMHLPPTQRQYAELLRTYLENIVSPFVNQLSQTQHSLTATEVCICNMIRNGLRTKEIAKIRGVSTGTINRHREHIRRKLKISNNDVNLATYLQSTGEKKI